MWSVVGLGKCSTVCDFFIKLFCNNFLADGRLPKPNYRPPTTDHRYSYKKLKPLTIIIIIIIILIIILMIVFLNW